MSITVKFSTDSSSSVDMAEEEGEESKYDDDLLRTEPPVQRMFSYDWARGYVSPYRPSDENIIEAVFRYLKPEPSKDVIIDLGCGDGRVLLQVAKLYQCRCVGIELDEVLVEDARRKVEQEGLENLVQIRKEDLLQHDLTHYSIIFMYLLPSVFGKLEPRLRKELEAGKKIISIGWPIPNWDEFRVHYGPKFHIYSLH